jgi:hypothetical protein
MSSIKPIIRKNLIYAKRNSFKSLIQLFYPCLFLVLFILLKKEDKGESPQDPMTHYDQINILSIKNVESFQYDKIISGWGDSCYAVIGQDENTVEKFKNFIINTASKHK